MNKRNYQLELDKIIENINNEKVANGVDNSRLLLHACCAPCSSYVLEYLHEFFDITILFYNPNIEPESEYAFRLSELKRLIQEMNFTNINIVTSRYDNVKFHQLVKGFEDEREGGSRCRNCITQRLEEAAKYASEHGFDYFASTLTISPMKNATMINEIGQELEKKYNIRFLPSDFKKRNGYKRSIELSHEYNLYRQNYCGCIYSKQNS
ncbi:MAG: epoxyqueuosine reductase QueH [Lachnospiraceae bacterium]|jgi:predicted adenine nucleotide alpha hydrolase (AANH) superfamily ATPase|nr:epoxyqueuosine reductase QueH [Lachnospiraceae bacterium]